MFEFGVGISEERFSRLETLVEEVHARTSVTYVDTSFNSPNIPVAEEINVADQLGLAVPLTMVVGNPVRSGWEYYLNLFEQRLVGTPYKIIRSRFNADRICISTRQTPARQLLVIPHVTNNRFMKAIYVIFCLQCNGNMEYFLEHHNEYLTEDNVAACCAMSTPPNGHT